MSATSQPITPEFFLHAIRELDLEQLHAEAARLELSLYHLRRSQIQLEEFKDDPVCQAAIEDNKAVIKNQTDRVNMIRLEVERRGYSMEHGARARGTLVNGSANTEPEEDESSPGPEVETGGAAAVEASPSAANANSQSNANAEGEEEEEGVYL